MEHLTHNPMEKAKDHQELQPAQIMKNELPRVSLDIIVILSEREKLAKPMRRERTRDHPTNFNTIPS